MKRPVMIHPAVDTTSTTWSVIRKHAQDRLTAYRAELDSEATHERRTQALRGRVAELTDLLALSEARPLIPAGGRTHE